jgi:hypothetical protein
MKKNFLFVFFLLLSFLATGNLFSQKQKVTVIVFNSVTQKPVENAKVSVHCVKDATDVSTVEKNTNRNGKCDFLLEFGPSFQYNAGAQKKKFYPCYSTDPSSDRVSMKFITALNKNVTLYLAPDSLQLLEYYASLSPVFKIDSLIGILKTDKYPSTLFPALQWEDIPKLLRIANEDGRISHFPRNPASSYDQNKCYLGIVALWMIESIRTCEGKTLIPPHERYPSLFPRLFNVVGDKVDYSSGSKESSGMMNKAYNAYLIWWRRTNALDRKEACKFNPLQNSGVSW